MNRSFPGDSAAELAPIEVGLELPDPDDRHVLAAAIRSRADAIVTANVIGFPTQSVTVLGIEVIHPDDFLISQLDMGSRTVLESLAAQAAAAKNPKQSLDDVITSLDRAGAPRFADEVRRRLSAMAISALSQALGSESETSQS